MNKFAVSFHTPETKQQSKQWLKKGLAGPVRAKIHFNNHNLQQQAQGDHGEGPGQVHRDFQAEKNCHRVGIQAWILNIQCEHWLIFSRRAGQKCRYKKVRYVTVWLLSHLERGIPYEHFVEEGSNRPVVHLLAVADLPNHLWKKTKSFRYLPTG